MNRISVAVERMRLQIIERVESGKTTQAAVDRTCAELDLSFPEFVSFQELKSLAVMDLLSLEEGQVIFGYLGQTPEHFNGQPVHVKATLTQVFGELLAKRIKARKTA